MDKKLEAYRRQQKRKEAVRIIKDKILNMLPTVPFSADSKPQDVVIEKKDLTILKKAQSHSIPTDSSSDDEQIAIETPKKTTTYDYLAYVTYIVYFVFWATLYAIAIELQFGMVFFMLSLLFGIYINTRTAPKRKHEVSAYSVFNKNCEAIDGTLDHKQFEREIGLRMK